MELKITEKTAREMYSGTLDDIKKMLEENFTKEFFSEKITDRVKTFADALEECGKSCGQFDAQEKTPDEVAYRKLKVIGLALNEGGQPDWTNSSEVKYYPRFRMGSASGFAYYSYGDSYAASGVGSRLCFKSQELAEYAGKQFTEIYKDFLTI